MDWGVLISLCLLFRISRLIYFHFFRLSSLKRMRRRMQLFSTRDQDHTLDSIQPAMIEMRERYPKAGAREMTSILFHEKGMRVPR